MQSTILGFTGFMAQEPDEVVGKDMAAALQYQRKFWREVDMRQEPPKQPLTRLVTTVASLLPESALPRETYINGYDPTTGERLAAVQIINRDGEPVAYLGHGDPITVTKIDGPNCHVSTETGVQGFLACVYTQLPDE